MCFLTMIFFFLEGIGGLEEVEGKDTWLISVRRGITFNATWDLDGVRIYQQGLKLKHIYNNKAPAIS